MPAEATEGTVSFGSPNMAALGSELFGGDSVEPPGNGKETPREGGGESGNDEISGGSDPEHQEGSTELPGEKKKKEVQEEEASPKSDKTDLPEDKPGIVDDWDDGKPKEEGKKEEEIPDSKLSPEDWRTKRLNVVASQRNDAIRELEATRRELEAIKAGVQQKSPQQRADDGSIIFPPIDAAQPAVVEAYRSQLSQEIAKGDPEIASIDQQLAKIQEDAKAGKYASNMDYAAAYQPLLTRREIAIRAKADAVLADVQRRQQAPIQAQRQAQAQAQQQMNQVIDEWNEKVTKSSIPDAKKYQDRMVKMCKENPQVFHDNIIAAILTDDESDLMTAAVMSKRKNVETLENISAVYAGRPVPPKVYAQIYEMKRIAKEELSGAAKAKAKKEAESKLPDDIGGHPSSSELSDSEFRKMMKGPNSRQKGAAALGLDINF